MKKSRETPVGDVRYKRKKILDAAFEVFSRRGYNRATVDEIIAIADTGKGTVYNYFVNKEQLFYTLIQERSAPLEAALDKVVTAPGPALAKLETLICLFLRFFVENGDLWRVMMHEVRGLGESDSQLTPAQREKYHAWFTRTVGVLEVAMEEGMQQKVIRECDATKASYALFSVIVMMAFRNFVDEDVEACARSVADVFFNGVAVR